jgi:hypothetical protein
MSSNHTTWLRKLRVGLLGVAVVLVSSSLYVLPTHAQDEGDFNIQVAPSPLAVTLTPGKAQTATITIRNFSSHSETLRPELNGFKIDPSSKKIELTTSAPADIAEWVSFKQPTITLAAGASQPLEISYNTPANVGFSYAFAVVLHRANEPGATTGERLKAAVAVFNLVNINRPDAKRELAIDSFTSDKGHYEFLPAQFTLTISNKGNVIDQPAGNIFIQRTFNDSKPIATLPINREAGYILPATTRAFSSSWQDGFPVYATTVTNGKTSVHLTWDWKRFSGLRFGHYVAKAVLVYNDGHRDVPLVASTSFWVIPWRIVFAVLALLVIVVMGILGWGKLIMQGTKKVRKYARRR